MHSARMMGEKPDKLLYAPNNFFPHLHQHPWFSELAKFSFAGRRGRMGIIHARAVFPCESGAVDLYARGRAC